MPYDQIIAMYRSKCPWCGEWIERDDMIARIFPEGDWVHSPGCKEEADSE